MGENLSTGTSTCAGPINGKPQDVGKTCLQRIPPEDMQEPVSLFVLALKSTP